MTPSTKLAVLTGVAFGFLGGFAAKGEVGFPAGDQNFEAMAVGADLTALGDWVFVNTSTPSSLYTVVAADDVLGSPTTRGGSTRWLRVTDQDAADVQNRFYSTVVIAPEVHSYTWTYFVNLETTPPAAGTKPKFSIQHNNNPGGFANAWGVEFTSTGANLIVFGIGGTAASTPLYPMTSPTGVGDWVKIELTVDFDTNKVSASVNDQSPVSLPINLVGTADKKTLRFCFRGEGTGNSGTLLLDDLSVYFVPPVPAVGEWGMVVMSLLVLSAGAVVLMRFRGQQRA